MREEFQRLEILVGKEKMNMLAQKKVAVFGLGGVGGFAAEALARSGIGNLVLIDYDRVDITNINRQLAALWSTIGKDKTEVWAERIYDINPEISLDIIQDQYTEKNWTKFFAKDLDYIIDAIDMVRSKLHLIIKAKEQNIPIISSMGMGNKLDPGRIKLSDLYKTHTCPLAKVMRRELREKGIQELLCVFSDEEPIKPLLSPDAQSKSRMNGSTAFVPSVAGLMMASAVVRKFLGEI